MTTKTIELRNGDYIEYGFHLGRKQWFFESIYRETRVLGKKQNGETIKTTGYYGKPMIFFNNRQGLVSHLKKIGFSNVN